jgi:hypothetical protein
VKTKVMTVTPEMAAKVIERTQSLIAEGKFRQRTVNNATVEQYARAMREGKWILTHQGIGIGENGAVLDGQHRLEAIARSGVSVEMLVSTDIPLVGMQNGYKVMTMDAVDRGRIRGIGQQLQIGHGLANANAIAGICKAICLACTGDGAIKLSVTDTLAVFSMYEKEITVLRSIDCAWIRNCAISAALTMGIVVGEPGYDFARSYLLGDHKHTDPSNLFKRWFANLPKTGGTSTQFLTLRGVARAIKAHVEKEQITRLSGSPDGLIWLIDQQGRRANKIRGLFEVQPSS